MLHRNNYEVFSQRHCALNNPWIQNNQKIHQAIFPYIIENHISLYRCCRRPGKKGQISNRRTIKNACKKIVKKLGSGRMKLKEAKSHTIFLDNDLLLTASVSQESMDRKSDFLVFGFNSSNHTPCFGEREGIGERRDGNPLGFEGDDVEIGFLELLRGFKKLYKIC